MASRAIDWDAGLPAVSGGAVVAAVLGIPMPIV